jgi:histone-lysine N-methyltransferase SETD2
MSKTEIIGLESGESRSNSTTPTGETKVLYSNYEDKTEEVKKQFVVLEENQYISRLKNVYSASNEFMTCDCTQEIEDGINIACGPFSDCINRLTNIECADDQCGCGDLCMNQRFQRREYADVSIFLTSDKGYGMRANVDIPANTFIIEYMGDIVDAEEYKLRKERYDKEGIKHFYFMMIQDNEIIDATKRASLGRYCNHSCDPNAYVDKWVVNRRFRMGIFSKKKIVRGEEICFDYNVDRYGAEPQKCYCGAANCLGVMGGKTQSESVRLLPHIITEALGVRASDEKRWMKEQKKNGLKITTDNIDSNVNVEFVKALELQPIEISEVAKISSCLMQPDLDIIVIDRILERLLLVSDEDLPETLTRLNRLHGIQALGNALKTIISSSNKTLNIEQKNVIENIIYIFERWPKLKSKNSIQDGEIESSFEILKSKGLPVDLQSRLNSLSDGWSDLEVVYRIPKKQENNTTQTILDDRRSRSYVNSNTIANNLPTGPASLTKQPWGDLDISLLHENRKIDGIPLPPGWQWTLDPSSKKNYYFNRHTGVTQWEKPEWQSISNEDEEKRKRKEREREREREREKVRELRDLKLIERERALKRKKELAQQEKRLNILSDIIAEATKSDDNLDRDSSTPQPSNSKSKRVSIQVADEKKSSKSKTLQQQWMTLFASYVPNFLGKYETTIGRENVKKCARDIVHLLSDKEIKRHVGETAPKTLSEERKAKIKSFSKGYMVKFLEKFEGKKRKIDEIKLKSKRPKA